MSHRQSRPQPRVPWELRLARFFREDRASATMISYIVGASVFLAGMAFLLTFALEPPANAISDLEHRDLTTQAEEALKLLVGSGGYPPTWHTSQAGVDDVERLGLRKEGATLVLDPEKFAALARGRFAQASTTNGYVDYDEAKLALGLEGYDFHVRAYPEFDPASGGGYGVAGMENFRIAYIGDFQGATRTDHAKSESYGLEELAIGFHNATRTSMAGPGDVYPDDSNDLRAYLVPLIGTRVSQSVLSQGAGTKYDFGQVDAETVAQSVTGASSRALALVNDDGDLGYTKARELRAILGTANLGGVRTDNTASLTISWKEWVDTDRGTLAYDEDDYGFVEVSTDGGQSWTPLTDAPLDRSRDTATSPQTPSDGWKLRAKSITSGNCAACFDNEEVLVAFHWIADNDNVGGDGWLVDDVVVEAQMATVPASTTRAFSRSFESAEYDLVIVGSNVDHDALVPQEVKGALRDYVMEHGGRIAVMGGDTNANWLEPLFQEGDNTASPGVGAPDPTHPMLTLPNRLAWEGYRNDDAWTFNSDDRDLFNPVVLGDAPDEYLLAASKAGAFGDGTSEGGVLVTTYLPYTMADEELFRFLANTVTYGKYHHVYMEVGPPVPAGVPVATAVRTATMDSTRDAAGAFTDMTVVLYLWPGGGARPLTSVTTPELPSAPQNVVATAGDGFVDVSWSAPDMPAGLTSYDVWRGTSPSDVTTLVANTGSLSFRDVGVTNGKTYWYNVSANNPERGAASAAVSASPYSLPSEPWDIDATSFASEIHLDWTRPNHTGPATITGYRLYNNTTTEGWTLLAEIGNTTEYVHTTNDQETRWYRIEALNGRGYGPTSTQEVSAAALMGASVPRTFNATNGTGGEQNTLTWTAPASLGSGTLVGYNIYAGTAPDALTLLSTLASPANVSFTHNVGVDNQTWWYEIAAITDAGEGTRSGSEIATTYAVPYPPQNLRVVDHLATGSVALAWDAPASNGGTPVTGYEVQWWDPAASVWTTLATNHALTSYTHADCGTDPCSYRVAAINAAGTGNAAEVRSDGAAGL